MASKLVASDPYQGDLPPLPTAEAVPVQQQQQQQQQPACVVQVQGGQYGAVQSQGLEGGYSQAQAPLLSPQQQQQLADVEMIIRHGFVRKVMGILTVQLLVTFGIVAAFLFNQCPNVWSEGDSPYDVGDGDGDDYFGGGGGFDPAAIGKLVKGDKEGNLCSQMWHKSKTTDLTCVPIIGGNDKLGCKVQTNYGPYIGSAFGAWFVSLFLICGMMAKARKYPTNYILLSIFTVCWGYFLAVICVFKSAQVVGLAVAITVALTGLLMLFACQTKYARRTIPRDSAFSSCILIAYCC